MKGLGFFVMPAGLFLCAAVFAQQMPKPNYDESKAGHFTLPDPLVFSNVKPVRNASDWQKRRRELVRLFQENVYGFNPPTPKHIRFDVLESDAHALDGKAIRKQVRITFPARRGEVHEDLLIYIPASAPKPVPLILALNFMGNQAVIDDPGIRLPMIWNHKTFKQNVAPENSRGKEKNFEVQKVLADGYGFATVYYEQIEPDFKDGYKYGIISKFFKPGQSKPGPDDWGAIGAWAYGLSRAMDYLVTDRDVDSKRVIVMGHSRLGKTALWAGALDTRFALVIANCPGEGGAAVWRRHYGETLESMSIEFPFWFCRYLMKYVGRENKLPVDQHELIALIAPRPVYVTSAEKDQWADPRGEFLACVAAGPVYRLLGKEGLGTDEMPAINHPIMHTIAFHERTGIHEVTAFDWDQFLKFADMHLRRH